MSMHVTFHRWRIGLTPVTLLALLTVAAHADGRQPRANDQTTIKSAPAEACAALDQPDLRDRMDGLLFNLLWSCGRQSEIVQVPEVESFEDIAENLSDAVLATDVQVNNSSGETGTTTTQSETSITRSPVTGTLCSAYNDSWEYYGAGGGGGFTGFARSINGGASWQDRGAVGSTTMGDPSLVWRRRDGHFYLGTLESGGALSIWRSTDDCFTFSKIAVPSTGSDDKEILAVDNNPASLYYGNIYMVWTDFGVAGTPIRVMRSTDGGLTWSAALNLSAAGTVQGAWPAVAPNGTVYVAWLRYASWPSGNITVEVARSTNGGVSYSAVASPLSNATSPRASAASTSCSRPALNGNIRYLASPQIAVTSDGALHVVYSYDADGFNVGDVVNVYYRRSLDGGATWGPEAQLNDLATNDQYFPTIQADGLRLVAGWYDRRNDPGNLRQDYYKRVSTNAGTTWGPNVRVSDVNSPIRLDPNLAACYHGDYDQSVVSGAGEVMQWADDRNLLGTRNDADVWSDVTSAVPDFSVTCAPASLTLPRGTSVATTCTVTSSGGFSSAVTLSCGSLPAGVSCSQSPNPVTPPANGSVSSSVNFTASAAATLGAATVQVSGTSGATTRSASVTLNVTQPDYSVACSPASLSLPRNQTRTTTCTVTSTGGFSSAVALGCSSLPSGVTCSASPASVTPPANGSAASSVTFTAGASAALGTFGVQVNGTNGATVRSAGVTLVISDPLAVAITSTHTVATCLASGGTPGYSYAWWITPAVCVDPCPGGCCLLNGEPDVCCIAAREGRELPIPCPIQAPRPQSICPEEGPYTTAPANQWVWNGSEESIRCSASDATSATVFSPSITRPAPDPDFTLSCSPSSLPLPAGQSASTTCTVTSLFNFASAVTLSCGNLPAGVTCSASPNPVTPPANGSAGSAVTFTASAATAVGSYTVQVNGASGALNRGANVTLTVAVPNFALTCSPSSLTLPRSQSRSSICTVSSSGGFASPVALSCGNLGAGVTCAASPSSVTPPANGSVNATLTFSAGAGAALGSFTAVVTGVGGALTRTANVGVTVTDPLVANISPNTYTSATCAASGGTPGYTYSWYVTPLSCVDPCPGGCCLANGEPDACCIAAREGRELPVPCPIQAPRPQSICPEEGPFTSSPANQWFWNGSEASVRCQVGDAAGAFALSASVARPAPPADFTLTCSPTSLTASPGGAVATTCSVTSLNSFASPVSLSCASLPAGVSCSPSPNPITPPANGVASSSVTFSVTAGTALGSYSVQVNGSGGALTRSAGLTLNVSNAPLSATISAVPGVSATCNASGGTPAYTYRWYVRYACDPCLMANKERIARGEPSLPCPINGPNPEVICPWEGPYTSTPANQWQLFGDETGVRCNVIDAVGASVTVTQLL